jgi:hypothetical protein
MDARFEWTEATIELAVSMWNAGQGAAEIASVLGTTRNSVIGKMHRTAKVRDDIKRFENPVPNKNPNKKALAIEDARAREAEETKAREAEEAKAREAEEAKAREAEEAKAREAEEALAKEAKAKEAKAKEARAKEARAKEASARAREAEAQDSVDDDLQWHPTPIIKQQQPVLQPGVSFFDVKFACQCRWPLWGDRANISIEDKRFCGRRTSLTSSWCPEHEERVFAPKRS